jgi:nucleotide-binding universal stress UspA family protein
MDEPKTQQTLFKNILFCTDFSENADLAFDSAVWLAKQHPGCSLTLLHIVPESDAQFWKTYIYEVDNVDQKAKNDIDSRVNEAYRSRIPKDLAFKAEFRVGKDSMEILDYAEKEKIDLIVMGRHGKSGLQKAFFGNVVEKVVRKAPCAVLVIPQM